LIARQLLAVNDVLGCLHFVKRYKLQRASAFACAGLHFFFKKQPLPSAEESDFAALIKDFSSTPMVRMRL
jgi:hypothetical protein